MPQPTTSDQRPDPQPESADAVRAITDQAQAARAACSSVATLAPETRDAVLRDLADAVERAADRLIAENAEDLRAADASGLAPAKRRRLVLSADGLSQMAAGLRQVAALPHPVGATVDERTTESGLRVRRVRTPLGVVAMIYEARPGVTIDAFALCFKAGNACLLKGGREAVRSNTALAALAHRVLADHGVPEAALSLVTTSDRHAIRAMLSLDREIDLVIPRGGETLIRFVHEHSRIPTIQHFHGVCHIVVDVSADVEQAVEIIATAKAGAPATCNAAECVLVHRDIAPALLPALDARLRDDRVEFRGDERVRAHAPHAVPATDDDFGREFLDLVLAGRVVDSLDQAIEHIARHGSDHTESILTRDDASAERFCREVRSSCVLVNASTRFNDGFQLGLGAEIGISTTRLHAYGPMGLEELTIPRYVVTGDGHAR